MPFIIPGLISLAAFLGGAFIGAENTVKNSTPQAAVDNGLNIPKMALYGLGAVGLVWIVKKTGATKFLK